MSAILLLLLAQPEAEAAPFRALLRIEESSRGSDVVSRRSGTLAVGRDGQVRVSISGAPALLDLWTTPWAGRFDVSIDAPAEASLPDEVRDSAGRAIAPIRARRTPGSMAVAAAGPEAPERIRLVSRDPDVRGRYPSIFCWRDRDGRLVRAEAEGPSGRVVISLESIR